MKLNFFSLEHEIDFSENNVWRLMIENQGMFIDTVNKINNLCNGIENDEKISLYKDETIIRWDKEVAFIINPWYMTEYEKNLQGNLHKYIEKEIIQSGKLSAFQDKVNEINSIFSDVIADVNLEVIYKNIMVVDYLKTIGLKANIGEGNAYNNVINLLNSMSYVKGYKLIILANSDIYFSRKELVEIIKQVRYNELNILMLDICQFEYKIVDEAVLCIDKDFCEKVY